MQRVKIDFNEEIFNETYLRYLDNTNRFLVFYGGAGSGKSFFAAQRYIYHCLKDKYFRLIFCRKIAKTIRNSQFLLFKDLISKYNLTDYFTIKDSTMEILCSNGNMMIAAGLDDREKIKSIQEPNHVWCEEATEFTKEDVLQLNLRLRTKKADVNQVTLTFNPVSTHSWLYGSFFASNEFADSQVVKTTFTHNLFIDDQYKKQLNELQNIDENYHKIYGLGEWGSSLKGVIYANWSLCDTAPDGCEILYGIDFGLTNPTAVVKIYLKENILYCEEIVYQSGMTNSDLIQLLKEKNIRQNVYADSAEPNRIEEMYRAGINVKPSIKGKDSVRKGIDTVRSKSINIFKNSGNIIKEINAYKWAEDKEGRLIRDQPVKYMDHSLDAIRYAVVTHLKMPTGIYDVSLV